jgi:predicted aspartyl protease
MIDTGASITSLSQERFDVLSRDSHFEYLGWRLFNTAGGPARGTVYRASSLQLGAQALREVDIAVLDFQQGPGIDGLLGMNVLRHFHFEIDQDRDLLHLQQR